MKDLAQRAQTPQRERRGISSGIELREAADGGGYDFTGYASMFNQPYTVYDMFGEYQERVSPGTWTKTLSDKADVRLLVNHDGVPLARSKSGTLQLTEDNTGLRSIAPNLDPANPTVQEIRSAMGRGDIDQMSMAFRVIRQEWNGDYTERNIIEAELFDVSIVTFPASPTTSASLRSRELLDVLRDLVGVPPEQSLMGMRSSRQMPTQGSLRALRGTLDQLLTSRDLNAEDDPAVMAQAVDASIDAALAAHASGDMDLTKSHLAAASVASDNLLDAMGLADPDLDNKTASKLITVKHGSSIALLRRQLDLIA